MADAEVDPSFVEDCPFCRIAHGLDSSAQVIFEANDWIAFFPLDPATPGHTLVIPRVHVRDVWELDPALAASLMAAVVSVGRAVKRALTPEGLNLISSAGEAAEQTVFHLHLHVVPRWSNDAFGQLWPPKRPMGHELEDDAAERVRAAIRDIDG